MQLSDQSSKEAKAAISGIFRLRNLQWVKKIKEKQPNQGWSKGKWEANGSETEGETEATMEW